MTADLRIRIHPIGQGHRTNTELVKRLSQQTPESFRKAQDVLLAAEKYNQGSGLIKSESPLIQKLQTEIYGLKNALREDNYKPELNRSPMQLVFAYLNEWSDAFPNWQREYVTLNDFIPLCLEDF